MAKSSSGSSMETLLIVGGVGVVAWYLYENWATIFPQAAAAAAAVTPVALITSSNSVTSAPAAPAPPVVVPVTVAPVIPAVTPAKPTGDSGANAYGGGTLASLYIALIAATSTGQDPAITMPNGGTPQATPYVFNVYLKQLMPSPPAAYASSSWPPDPMAIWGSAPSMPITQYWSGMSYWLAQNFGMSGLGVFYG